MSSTLPAGWTEVADKPDALPEGWSVAAPTPTESALPEGWSIAPDSSAPAPVTAPGILERFDSYMRRPKSREEVAADTANAREIMMRLGVPVAAALAAPGTGGLSLALAAAGGFTGEIMAQESEMERGVRDSMGVGQLVAAPIVAGTPLGPAVKPLTAFGPAGNLLASVPQAVVKRGAYGGAISAGASVIQQGIDQPRINWGEVGKSAAWGTVFGAVMGGVESARSTGAYKKALADLSNLRLPGETDLNFIERVRREIRSRPAQPVSPAPAAGAEVQSLTDVAPPAAPMITAPAAPVGPAAVAPVVPGSPLALAQATAPAPVVPPVVVPPVAAEPVDAAPVEPAAPYVRPADAGNEWVAKSPDDAKVPARGIYRVIEGSSLVTSQDPGYHAENQPRDRGRAASRDQIERMAAAFDPVLATDSHTTDLGAPFVSPDSHVLSGNGRTEALRMMYANFPEPAARYKQFMIENAAAFGLDPAAVGAMKAPVLVRQIEDFGGDTPAQFAERANRSQVLGMSESEVAARDATALVKLPELLRQFLPDGDGNVLAASNRTFLAQFFKAVGADNASILTADGSGFRPAVAQRVRNAVLGALVGPEKRNLIDALVENNEGIKKVSNGLLNTAPKLIALQGTPFDLSPTVARAALDFVSFTHSGEKIGDFLGQTSLFGDARSAAEDFLLLAFHELKSAAKVTQFLNRYAELSAQIDTTTSDMFGQADASPLELLQTSYNELTGPDAPQADLSFGKPTPPPGPAEPPPAAPPASPQGNTSEGQEAAQPAAKDPEPVSPVGSELKASAPPADPVKSPAPGRSDGAVGAPGFAASPPAAAGPAEPPISITPPASDPNYTQLPVELPEAVQFFKLMNSGQYPKVRDKITLLHGQAAGVFRYQEGDMASGTIELRADQFNLLSLAEKNDLLREAVAYATTLKQGDPRVNFKEAVRAKFEELVTKAENESASAGPRRALAVFWHEIGHFLDFYPSASLKRGNILGRLASLHHYLKGFLGKAPGIFTEPPTAGERATLRRKAEKELRDAVKSIVETIRREEPIYREISITADDITNILKTAAREDYPQFYDWFASLDRANKAAVLRAAMKGVIDPRVKAFNRKEATGEKKVVEEQVTRMTGPEPTAADIKKRFDELIRVEFDRRGLLNEREIREELATAIAWWRGVKKMPEYFRPAPERWAEAISIFFNNPRGLAERAPKFYTALLQWMAVKPGLREEYDKLQSDIKSGQVFKDRVTNLRDMLARDAQAAVLLDDAGRKTTMRDYVDTARLLFDRQFGPIERRIGRAPSAAGAGALSAIGDFRYRVTAWEAFALDMRSAVEVPLAQADLSHEDMAEFMFHKRITAGRYRNLAAPLGWNPKASGERLAEMERDLGPDRWKQLVGAQVAMRAAYVKHVITLLHRAGVMSPELATAVDAEFYYAPFNKAREFTGANLDAVSELVKLNFGNDASSQIFGATGNLGEIRSPYVQLYHRAFGLISMAHRQLATKAAVAFLQDSDPLAVAEAPLRWNGRRLEVVRVDNGRVATLYALDHGTVKGYYVPQIIGEMFARGGAAELRAIALSHAILSPAKALLTELNPAFWPVAFVKDVWGATVQLPAGARVVANLPRAYLAARRTFSGKTDALAQRMLDRMIFPSNVAGRGEHLGHPDEMTRIMLRLGKDPAAWDKEMNLIERALRAFWLAWSRQGQVFERTTKIASMMAMDRKYPNMPEALKREMVRTFGGSPDFLSKGRWAHVVELMLGMMFYNAWKEGTRSTWRAIRGDSRGFWLKFSATIGGAAALFWAFESGAVGDGPEMEELRDKLRAIPERDKLRGFVIPLGWVDKAQGKLAYLMLPFPDSLRVIHAVLRKSFQTAGQQDTKTQGLGGLVNYQGQDIPGQNPWITSVKELWAYFAENRNPYDEFTGRPALDETAVAAGRAGPELLKRSLSNVTGGVAWRYRNERPAEKLTDLEVFLRQPFVSNIVGRWVRVSSRGLDEYYQNAAAPTVKEQASLQLVGEEIIGRTFRGEEPTAIQTALLAESEYLRDYLTNAAPRLLMQGDSPYLRQLSQARTQAEKLAIVKAENARQLLLQKQRFPVTAPAKKP